MKKYDEGLKSIRELLGQEGVVEKDNHEPYITEWRGLWRGNCSLIARPVSTQEVSGVVKICNEHNISIVPQGGNTGLVGGAVPNGGIVISTQRMQRIIDVDPINMTLTCEAGCILKDLQTASENAGRLFPLSLAAEGSCSIGGNLSTNAGGIQVLRYGNTRDLVLGIEVVLPNGEVWNGLRALRKDNTGYDIKHLFVGGEGTLGIITSAILKLFPAHKQKETALVAVSKVSDAIELLSKITSAAGDSLTAFELMNNYSFNLPIKYINGIRQPFTNKHNWYILIELTSPQEGRNLRAIIEKTLLTAVDQKVVEDAILAETLNQAQDFWKIRESIPEAQGEEGGSIKNDITVPISKIPEFLNRANKIVETIIPNIRPLSFGHAGDGNIHYNLTQPEDMDRKTFLNQWHIITNAINEIVADLNGSFSAEHGIGQLKIKELQQYRPGIEVQLMKIIKHSIDPKNIMNPGKLFDL